MDLILTAKQMIAAGQGRALISVLPAVAPYAKATNFDGWTTATTCHANHRSRRWRSRT